jgi:DeoR/GlpR family transcriptional regulator of sugar metabolism
MPIHCPVRDRPLCDVLSQVNIDLAFMSASGFSVDRGFTVSNMNECAFKKACGSKSEKGVFAYGYR